MLQIIGISTRIRGDRGFIMFRKMRRFKQQIADSECIEVLKSTKRDVLSLIGDDGYPYGIPILLISLDKTAFGTYHAV